MNKKGMGLFNIFIIIIIGAVLLVVLANTISGTIDLTGVAGESANVSNVSAGAGGANLTTLTNGNLSSVVVWNDTRTGIVGAGNYTLDTTVGTITFVTDNQYTAPTAGGNSTRIFLNYSYEGDDYLRDGTSRVIARQYLLFFVMAILLFVISYLYKEYGDLLT